MKRIISLVLCFLMIINIFSATAFAEEEQNLEEIIRPQIEAFAKSIDQKNAAGGAQDALVLHGLGGSGKKLSVGKNHAITATIVNSELIKEYLTKVCILLIETANEMNMDKMYSVCETIWYFGGNSRAYNLLVYDYDATHLYNLAGVPYAPGGWKKYVGWVECKAKNSYDDSLAWMVGGICIETDIKQIGSYDDKVVYEVSNIAYDKFDFDTDNSTALEDLLGWVGMLLFEPFKWEAKCDFQIEIPVERPEENKVFGDSDGNGSVDVADAYFARLVAAKIVKPTEEQLALCDVDSDGKITAIDANIIRKFALGIIKELPVQ